MRTSNYSVINRKIKFCDVANITGNKEVDTFHFDFDSEWNVFNYKYLVLFVGTKSYIDLLDSNNNVVLRSVAYDRDDVTFGVIGKNVPIEEGEIEEGEEIVPTSPTLSSNIVWLETIPSAFGQIKTVDGLPDKTVWELYTEEMLALLAQGQITLEQCEQALNDTETARDAAQGYMNDAEAYKNTTKGYMDATEGYKNDTNQLKQDTQGIVDTFNANVSQKTIDFNNNATQKTTDFNQNAIDKTNTFNQNVTDKTTAFNNNASSKTGDFNDNATSKTNTFNANVTSKTNTFNQNAQDKLDAVTSAGTTAVGNVQDAEGIAITHIQTEGASYDARLTELEAANERLRSNFDTNTPTPSDSITITDSLNARVEKFTLIGKTGQNTTSISEGDEYDSPSPEHTQPLNNVEGDVVNNSSNKNLVDTNDELNYGIYTSNIQPATGRIAYLVKIKPNTTYTFLRSAIGTATYCHLATLSTFTPNQNNDFITDYTINTLLTKTITTESNANYIMIFTGQGISPNIQLEEGSTTTPYVEHQGKSITFPLSEGQKLMEGDFLAEDGIHHVRKQVDMGDLNYTYTSTGDYFNINLLANMKIFTAGEMFTGKSTVYIAMTVPGSAAVWANRPAGTMAPQKDGAVLRLKDTRYTDPADLKTALAGQILEYPLAEDEIEPYTEAQQTAWNELQKLETYKNITHIYTSSDVLAPDAEVTYLVDPLASIKARLDLLEG